MQLISWGSEEEVWDCSGQIHPLYWGEKIPLLAQVLLGGSGTFLLLCFPIQRHVTSFPEVMVFPQQAQHPATILGHPEPNVVA